jgi:hypothetical protein
MDDLVFYERSRNDDIKQHLMNKEVNSKNKIIMLTTFYECCNEKIYGEWFDCLRKYLQDSSIEKIILFLEGFSYLKEPIDLNKYFNVNNYNKIIIVKINCKPCFFDLFGYANFHFKEKNILISNINVFLENIKFITNINMNNVIFTISRHSFLNNNEKNFLPCDCWIFKTPFDFDDRYNNIFLNHKSEIYINKLLIEKSEKCGYKYDNIAALLNPIYYDSI